MFLRFKRIDPPESLTVEVVRDVVVGLGTGIILISMGIGVFIVFVVVISGIIELIQ